MRNISLACAFAVGLSFPLFGAVEITAKPNQSLAELRDAVRKIPLDARKQGVVVQLAAQAYRLSESVEFTRLDSGCEAPVTWRGASGGRTIITGSTRLLTERFERLSDAEVAHRLDARVAQQVLSYDLSGLDLAYWTMPTNEIIGGLLPIPEIYVDGMRMTPASWPNDGGWSEIKEIKDAGTDRRGGAFVYAGDAPGRWKPEDEIFLLGFWCVDWREGILPVKKVDANAHTITLAAGHQYTIRQGNPSPRRWRAIHALAELDRPGEFFIDKSRKRLYLLPPTGYSRKSKVELAGREFPLVVIDPSAHDIRFEGMNFAQAIGHAFAGSGFRRVVIDGCRMTNLRKRAIEVRDVWDCVISGCEFVELGSGGVLLWGGDRRSLVSGNNVIEYCLFRNFSIQNLTYEPAVHLAGVGCRVSHCEMSGSMHMAANVSGNDNIFEFNVISNVCTMSDDCGAMYKGRDPSDRGNVFRYNLWKDIGCPRGHGNCAIYFDDGDCSDFVEGNVFVNCGQPCGGDFGAVFANGGYSNVVRNCIFVDCKRAMGAADWNWQPDAWEEYLARPFIRQQLFERVDIRSEVYKKRYPELTTFLDPPPYEVRKNAAYDNVLVNCGDIVRGPWYTNSYNIAFAKDPGFVDATNGNYALRFDSRVYKDLPHFSPIPFEEIGIVRKGHAGGYLVVDLSCGAVSSNCSVRLSPVAPNLSRDDCRTREMWFRRIVPGTSHSPYYVALFPVTQKQYELIAGRHDVRYVGDTLPVEKISFPQAMEFARKMSALISRKVDLPKESEWEYACRAGTWTDLNSGKNLSLRNQCDEMSAVGRYYHLGSDGKSGFYDALARVGSYQPNNWGLYDFHGNVWEWCSDTKPGKSERHPIRGGSCFSHAYQCASGYRAEAEYWVHGEGMGFRLIIRE